MKTWGDAIEAVRRSIAKQDWDGQHAFRREEEAVVAYALARDVTRSAEVRARAIAAIAESEVASLGAATIDGWVVATVGHGARASITRASARGSRGTRRATERATASRSRWTPAARG